MEPLIPKSEHIDDGRFFLPTQEKIFWKFWTEYKDTCLIACRRLGKTSFNIRVALLLMYYSTGLIHKYHPELISAKIDEHMDYWYSRFRRGFHCTIFLPAANQGSDIFNDVGHAAKVAFEEHFPQMTAEAPIVVIKDSCHLETGGSRIPRLKVKGTSRFSENNRGFSNDYICIDEIQLHSDRVMKKIVLPTLDSGGKFMVCGTAESSQIIQDYRDIYDADPNRELIVVPITESIANGDITQEFHDIEILGKKYNNNPNDFDYRQEYLCDMNVPVTGSVLSTYSWQEWQGDEDSIDKMKKFISMDIGWQDNYAVLQWGITEDNLLILLDGQIHRHKTTREVIEMTKNFCNDNGWKIDKVFVDHHAAKNTTATDFNDYQQWVHYSKYDCTVIRQLEKKLSLRTMMSHLSRVYLHPKCNPEVIIHLRNAKFDEKKPDEVLHDKYSDVFDAWRYGIVEAFENYRMFYKPVIKEDDRSEKQKLIDRLQRKKPKYTQKYTWRKFNNHNYHGNEEI